MGECQATLRLHAPWSFSQLQTGGYECTWHISWKPLGTCTEQEHIIFVTASYADSQYMVNDRYRWRPPMVFLHYQPMCLAQGCESCLLRSET